MSEAATHRKRDLDQTTIRSWPKVIFLYPVFLAALVCGIYQQVANLEAGRFSELAGMVFFIVFALNVLVIAFDFSRFKMLALAFFILAVVFLLLYLSTRFAVFSFLGDVFKGVHISASSAFYFAVAIYFIVVFGMVYINTRFNYWIIRSNEILHKEGFMGDVKRFPSPNLKMTKEIPDVFEFLIWRAGRIVLYPASEKQAIVLDHVLAVNRKEKEIQELLSALSVEIEHSGGSDRHDEEADGKGF